MLSYVCKYTPIEIFEAFGEEIGLIDLKDSSFSCAESCMHPIMCSYSKGVFEAFCNNDYEGIILTSCCDSINRLYDALTNEFNDKFIYILDLPRKINCFTKEIYKNEIIKMTKAYCSFKDIKFSLNFVEKYLKDNLEYKKKVESFEEKIVLLGAHCSSSLYQIIENVNLNNIIDLTCSNYNRSFLFEKEDIILSYSSSLLDSIECLRMEDTKRRDILLNKIIKESKAIIYHGIKFCDIYPYEVAYLNKISKKPLLYIESEGSVENGGQLKTRLEAFLENLGLKEDMFKKNRIKKRGHYVLGIDSGSTSTNAVILNSNKEIVSYKIIKTGAKAKDSALLIKKQILEENNLNENDLISIVSTGYGRVSIDYANSDITEISCHAKGAYFLNPNIRTILDIGGQDSKAILLNSQGEVIDFIMNDKCAAGTGRFIEMICSALSVNLSEMGNLALKWKKDITISSTCSVFAESEVISLIADNNNISDILHGICKSIAKKSVGLLNRVNWQNQVCMTGGVAKNLGVRTVIEETLNEKLVQVEEPEIMGALGAALFALEKI